MTPSVAVVTPVSATGAVGGAERFYCGLRDALDAIGLRTVIVEDTCDETDLNSILASYLRFYDLDLSRFDGVISTKAPTYAIRHPNHICYLVHTMRVFYDMFDREFPMPTRVLHLKRRQIQELDSAAMSPSRLRAVYAIGEEVAARLSAFNGLTARVLHPPTSLSGFRAGAFRHVLLPGRLHRWKRVDMAIAAMRHVSSDIELIIPGSGEDAERFRKMAAGDQRIHFPGRVSDAALLDLYADSLVVLFLPEREDLGLVTFEAFLSGKPVITCTDSGEPARLVRDRESGFVCLPEPRAIAAKIEELAAAPSRAALMGAAGAASIAHITWPTVAATLARALGFHAAVP
jgi:glycosyltransferase involved in cell wall biosynthesis